MTYARLSRGRVLIAYPYMPHYRSGIFRAIDDLDDIRVVFASDTIGTLGVQVMPATEVRRHVRLRNTWAGPFLWQRGLLRLCLFHRFDAIVLFGDWKYLSTWVAAIICRVKRMPVLMWTIGWARPDPLLKRIFRLSFYHLADHLLLYGSVAKRIGISEGYPIERMTVIGNSIDTTSGNDLGMSSSLLTAWSPPSAEVILGAVLRLIPDKQMNLVIEAAHVLREQGVSVALLIVGDGPERSTLAQMARDSGVPAVFPGAVYSVGDLSAIYTHMTMTVVPGPVGLTAIQSLAFGVPVVTNSDPFQGGPEWEAVIPGRTGELFPPGDVQGLTEAILRMLSRITLNAQAVKTACHEEVQKRWTATAVAESIHD